MVGFYFAWTDFKPRLFKRYDDDISFETTNSIKLTIKKNEMTMRELGLVDLNNPENIPIQAQRTNKMNEKIRDYAIDSPDMAANVIKKWLRE